MGDTYTVELVERYKPPADELDLPSPYGGYEAGGPSCGTELDLVVGGSVALVADGKRDDNYQCDCYYVSARADVAGVQSIERISTTPQLGNEVFVDYFRAQIGDSCTGRYVIGIQPVLPEFIARSPGAAATDHMLFRSFVRNMGICPTPAPEPGLPADCWDSWSVRIRDAQGRIVTKDLRTATDGGT